MSEVPLVLFPLLGWGCRNTGPVSSRTICHSGLVLPWEIGMSILKPTHCRLAGCASSKTVAVSISIMVNGSDITKEPCPYPLP